MKKGDIPTERIFNLGELALGKPTVGYMPWKGDNYEDAIVLSSNVLFVKTLLTSVHVDETHFECPRNETRYGRVDFDIS